MLTWCLPTTHPIVPACTLCPTVWPPPTCTPHTTHTTHYSGAQLGYSGISNNKLIKIVNGNRRLGYNLGMWNCRRGLIAGMSYPLAMIVAHTKPNKASIRATRNNQYINGHVRGRATGKVGGLVWLAWRTVLGCLLNISKLALRIGGNYKHKWNFLNIVSFLEIVSNILAWVQFQIWIMIFKLKMDIQDKYYA